MTRIPEFDGLRALAVLPVLGFHLGWIPGGFLGVDVFFVLSGFLITSLLMGEESITGGVSLGHFYVRRTLRILPPLFIAVILAVLLGTATSVAPAVLFYANLVPPGSLAGLGHTWSLAIEEHFYLVWPAAFVLFARWRVPLLLGIVLSAIALRVGLIALGVGDGWIYRLTPTRMDALAIGCLVALRAPAQSLAGPALLAIFACYALVPKLGFWMLTFGFTAFATACAMVVASVRTLPILRMRPLQYIGRRSYGLYLYHWPIFYAVDHFYSADAWAAKLALSAVITEISYRTVEASASRLATRFRPEPRPINMAVGSVPL